MPLSLDELRNAHSSIEETARHFCSVVHSLLNAKIQDHGLHLAIPIESRVKSWPSIEEKFSRKSLSLDRIEDLDDLVGARVIFLFQRDVHSLSTELGDIFEIMSSEDTGTRLNESQFGYQSHHSVVRVPVLTLKDCGLAERPPMKAEIQIRTLAQHSWATASHLLQYKQEQSVPGPVRRSIHRVSALLETVDLEFERVLNERETYRDDDHIGTSPKESLNVDLLAKIADELLPTENKDGRERFDELLIDLQHFNFRTAGDVRDLIQEKLAEAMELDKHQAERHAHMPSGVPLVWRDRIRRQKIYHNHTGLIQLMMHLKYGPEMNPYILQKLRDRISKEQ